MQRNTIVFASITLTAMLLASTYGFSHFKSVLAAGTPASTDQVIYLNQGWSKADRDTYYWIPQGSVMMSYDIFQNLELADSKELFRSDASMERYGPPGPFIDLGVHPKSIKPALPTSSE
jgi:hypothetical protein